MDTEFYTGGLAGTGSRPMKLRDIIELLKAIYCGRVGFEFAHIARARREGQILLTRDRKLLERKAARGGHLVRGEGTMEELVDVVRAFGLPVEEGEGRLFSRCLECNRPLEARSREQVQKLVPPYVFQTQHQYTQCPACRRVYWRGTHWRAMVGQLERFGKS